GAAESLAVEEGELGGGAGARALPPAGESALAPGAHPAAGTTPTGPRRAAGGRGGGGGGGRRPGGVPRGGPRGRAPGRRRDSRAARRAARGGGGRLRRAGRGDPAWGIGRD